MLDLPVYIGIVTKINRKKWAGYIKTNKIEEIYFLFTNITNKKKVKIGSQVKFQLLAINMSPYNVPNTFTTIYEAINIEVL